MIKPEFTFERLLEIVLPGTVLAIGLWYLHRPFLSIYFPTVASIALPDPDQNNSIASKATVFFLITLMMGVVIRSLSDIAVATLFSDESESPKSQRKQRRLISFMMRLFLVGGARDPRILAVDRYLVSPRKERFLSLVSDWCFLKTDLHGSEEKVLMHQHLVTRLKVISVESRALIVEAFHPVSVFSSLFIALVALLFFGALSFLSNAIVAGRAVAHSPSFISVVLIFVYISVWIVAYALRRAMRQFASNVITLALHTHDERKK
jgi:hypothetical protein